MSAVEDFKGCDGEGRDFANPQALWQEAKDQDGSHSTWYAKAVDYWDHQEASYDGVLGGFGHVSDVDIADSTALLKKAFKKHLEVVATGERKMRALDCGAGVGRVTEQLLLQHFAEVDLLEPSQHLLDTAQTNLCGGVRFPPFPDGHKAVKFMPIGLQELKPDPERPYDCIWVQWCLLYLTDDDVLSLFARMRQGMTEDGIIIVKENICAQGFVVDNDDSSLTRSHAYMLSLWEKAGMQVIYSLKQRNFPQELFEVRMYALQYRR